MHWGMFLSSHDCAALHSPHAGCSCVTAISLWLTPQSQLLAGLASRVDQDTEHLPGFSPVLTSLPTSSRLCPLMRGSESLWACRLSLWCKKLCWYLNLHLLKLTCTHRRETAQHFPQQRCPPMQHVRENCTCHPHHQDVSLPFSALLWILSKTHGEVLLPRSSLAQTSSAFPGPHGLFQSF